MINIRPEPPPTLRLDADKNIWLDVSLNEDWRATYRLAIQRSRVVVAELRIFPHVRRLRVPQGVRGLPEVLARADTEVPAGGLSTRLLRQVRLGHDVHSVSQIVEYVQRNHPEALEPDGYLGRAGITAVLDRTRTRQHSPGRGRPSLPAHIYASLAAAYAVAVARGSRRPVQELAARLKEPIARIRSRIQTARRLGFLDRGVQGNAGGQLTPAAKRLLRKKGSRHGKKTTRQR